MSKRSLASIILVILAFIIMWIEKGIVGGMVGSFILVVMLFLWVFPDGILRNKPDSDPSVKRASQTVLGIGLGLLAAVIAAIILPPQIFSWVIIAAGIALGAWFFFTLIR
jgi:hypothetical protein